MHINDGDTVLVRALVSDKQPMVSGAVRVQLHGAVAVLPREDIVSVEPKPLAVGDRVRYPAGSAPGEIRAIADGYALIAWPANTCSAAALAHLVRA